MSADTSDPALHAAAAALHDPSDPTSWLVAAYAPGTTAIVLRATGSSPRFPGLRDAIEATKEVSFAYVIVRDKGLVVLVLSGVGGVKRAKAIVHARAFAAIFPRYLALATLTTAAELTDKLIAERLGMLVSDVVEREGDATPSPSAFTTAPSTQPASAGSSIPSSPAPPPPSKSPGPPVPPPSGAVLASATAESSSAGSTPGPGPSHSAVFRGSANAQPPSRERELPDLPDDPTTPRAAVQPATTSGSVVAPIPRRPRKRSASPPPSSGIEKTTPTPHSQSQPTSPSVSSAPSLPSMMSHAHPGYHSSAVPPTPTTPITPVTPKAPIDPNAPQHLYQAPKSARVQASAPSAGQREGADPSSASRGTAFPAAGAAGGLNRAVASSQTSPLLSSPNASFRSPSSSAISNLSDSPRQRSVSNSSGRMGSEASSTRPLSRDSGYWGGRPPSRDASVPTSVTSDSRRSSRRGSDPSFSPSMLGRMSMGDAPPVPPLPHELRRASREPLRGEPEPLRVASVPHSPASSPLIHSPHSRRGSPGSRHGHFMPAPLPVPDHPPPAVPTIPNPLPNPAGMPLAPSSAVGSPPVGIGSPPIPQRSRQRLASGHGGRPLPPPSPVPDGPLPPVPNVPPRSSKTPIRPPRRGLSSSTGPSPNPSMGGFSQAPFPPVPTSVREASLAVADSGSSSLMSSPLVSSPLTSPRISTEPVSPLSPNSRIGSGSGAFFSARSSMAEWRDSSRIDSVRSSMRNETSRRESDMRDSDQRDTDRPISTMLPYARSETSDPSPRPSEEREPAPSLAPAGLGLGIVSVDLTMPLRQRSLDRVEDSGARPLSTSSFASIKSNRAPPPPPVTIPVAARTPGVVAAPDSAPGSAASSIRSTEKKHGHKKSNSISRKPVPAMDPDLLSDSELLTHTPARKSSLRRVVGAGVSPQPAASQSVGGETELLAAPEALIAPPPRDSSRTSTPRIPPSPAFGTPPNLAAALDIDGGMLQSVSPSPKARSVGSPSGSSSSSPLVRAASVRESPRLASPALLERSRSLRAREVGTEVLAGPGRSVHGVDLAAVGSDVVGVAPASPAPASSALSRRPQTPQSQIRTLEDIASPRSVLSSPHSGEGLDILEASAVASAQAVTATPAHARVLSLSNGQVRAITPESSNSGRTRPTSSPVSPSRRIPGHAKSASESGTSMPNRSPALESGHSKSASTSETHTLQRGLGFGVLGQDREDEVERITVDDDVPIGSPEASSKAASTASPGSRHVIDLGSAGSTPVQAVTANMPMQSSPRRHQHELPPLPPAARGQLAPPMSSSSAGTAPTPHVVRHKTSSKFRLPFRSPRPPADDEDLSPPMSPTSARLRTHSITNAFRRRRNTNSGTPPGSPPVRSSLVSSNSTSEDHSTLPYEYGLQGLGLSSFALAPSAYRTPSGGIGYTPPKMERKLSLTAQEAFASARERHAIEQAQQLEAFRKSEKARTMSHTSSANPASRVTSVAMSSEFMSDDSHYDNASDELPQSLSLAMVTAAGSNPVASPVEQLAAAASAARQHRQEARYSPSSPTAGDEGAADRQRAREAALAQQRRLSVGDREDEFHDAVSQLDDDHDYSDSNSDSELELNGFDDDVEANEVAEREAAELAAAERAELAEREQREAAQREEARRLDLEVAEAAKRAAEEQRLQEEQESARAEEHRLQEEQEMALAAETRRLEKERLRLEAARMEQERLAAKEEEDHLAALLRAEEEERRVAADEQRRLQEEREAEEARLVQERRLAEMEERLAAQQEEARLAAEREAEREAAELAEAERLKAERVEQERAAAASAKAEQERIERAARERDEVTRQLQGGKAEGGIMLRGWVTVQTMNSPTWRRRYFHLLASELRLFKSDSENDTAKALTTVGLSGAKISEAYEESAVQGSWKLETGGKEYYMFADGAEDRATVLQGLAIAIA